MSRDRRRLAWSLFERCLELDDAGRAAVLRDECRHDDDLLRELERLFACDRRAAERRFLADSPLAVRFLPEGDDLIGRDIGPYRLEQQIGQGGMGYVYRAARQTDYQQTAAVKILRGGRGDQNLVRAFQNEVQLLAKVRQHPRIVGLLDAGMTSDGYAYLVMDYVPGQPLDEYCRQQALNWRERLRLFLQVCDAVAFAHRQLVTHRDLKPRNILVLEGGEAKLLDFGIAREESFGSPHTQTLPRACTPDYASPEQIRGESLSTSTDIYSLGVILYQLATGRRPYETANLSPGDIERRVCETDPPPLTDILSRRGSVGVAASPVAASPVAASPVATDPQGANTHAGDTASAAATQAFAAEFPSRDTARDLDAIILKAMAKSADQRYPTVVALADDVERLLRGDAVLARKRTTLYVVRKFTRRHRLLVATASLILASLVMGIVGTGIGLARARQEQRRAEASLALNRETIRQFMDLLERQQIGRMPGSQASRLELQRSLQAAAETLHRDLARDESSREQLAAVDLKVGQLLLSLGDRARALEYLRRARTAFESLSAAHADDDRLRLSIGDCWQSIGAAHRERLESDDCELAIQQGLATYRAVKNPALTDAAQIGEGSALSTLGRLAFEQRDFAKARKLYEQAEALFLAGRSSAPDAPSQPDAPSRSNAPSRLDLPHDERLARTRDEKLAQIDNDLCSLLNMRGEFAAAETRLRQGMPRVERLARQYPLIVDIQVLWAKRLHTLANAINDQGRFTESLPVYEQSDGHWRRIVEQNPDVVAYASDWSVVLRSAGVACSEAKQTDDAIRYYTRALELRQRAVNLAADQPKTRDDLARGHRSLGEALEDSEKFDEGLAQYERAESIHRQLVNEFPRNAAFLGALGHDLHARGMILKKMQRGREAVGVYDEAIGWCVKAVENSTNFAQNERVLLNLHLGRLELLRQTGDGPALLAALESAERTLPDTTDYLLELGVQWALCAKLRTPSDEPLVPDAAARGRELILAARDKGADLAELKALPQWSELATLPGYRELVEGQSVDPR